METFTFDDSGEPQVIRHVGLVDKATGKEFYNKLGYIYIQLAKLKKKSRSFKPVWINGCI